MDLIVEDGTGVVTANSYCTVAEADEFLSINIHSQWLTVDADTKAKLLIFATRKIEERVRWRGRKMHQTSGLGWPRCGVRDKEGFLIEDHVVPLAVKLAVATLADHLIAGNPDVVNTGSNLTEIQADVIKLKFDVNKTPDKYPSEIKFILSGLGTIAMGSGGPKRIVKH